MAKGAGFLGAARWRADIVHVTGDVHFLTYLLRRKRSVLTVLDCGLGRARSHGGAVPGAVAAVSGRAGGVVVAISDATAAELAALARTPVDRIRVIPISVDDGYVPVPRDDPRARPSCWRLAPPPTRTWSASSTRCAASMWSCAWSAGSRPRSGPNWKRAACTGATMARSAPHRCAAPTRSATWSRTPLSTRASACRSSRRTRSGDPW